MEPIDALDARILLALDEDPDATVLALARALGVARNTVSSRLARMGAGGVLGEVSRRLDPAALGCGTVAFVSVALSQASSERTIAQLRTVPEVVEMHSTTGEADLLLKVVARDTDDLHRLTRALLGVEGVVRTSTAISLAQELPTRYRELLVRVARGG
ncbi:Lrp/AsnC family transcriptional regulator [Kineococcus sp. SYSU DK005]|uniref:Lrp/AsnC family transcriptional regulator n=1 Tax=Kineococcus sp. SYSU DK005 TaxID=3383126 RepID=UPI003D7C372C